MPPTADDVVRAYATTGLKPESCSFFEIGDNNCHCGCGLTALAIADNPDVRSWLQDELQKGLDNEDDPEGNLGAIVLDWMHEAWPELDNSWFTGFTTGWDNISVKVGGELFDHNERLKYDIEEFGYGYWVGAEAAARFF